MQVVGTAQRILLRRESLTRFNIVPFEDLKIRSGHEVGFIKTRDDENEYYMGNNRG